MNALTCYNRLNAALAIAVLAATLLGGSARAHDTPKARTAAKPRVVATPRPRAQVRAGRDAFLPYQVNSTDELVAELKSNSKLRGLYQQHFGIPQDQVVDWVRNALVVYRLPEARAVNTYGVTRTGVIYPVRSHLKKGERVWATRSGLPVLRWACANPLTKKLPGTLLASKPKPAVPHRLPTRSPVSPAPVADNPVIGIETAPEIAAPTPVAVDTSALMPAPILSGSGGTSIPAGLGGPSAHIGPGFLPLFIPIAGIIAANPGGGGGGGSIPPSTTIVTPISPPGTPGGPGTPVVPIVPPADSPPATIPEPTTLVLLISALPIVGAVTYRRMRRA